MATDKNSTGSRGSPFLRGWIIGMLMGVVLGWWFRPPSSFPIEDLKAATEKKFTSASKQGKKELAQFAEELARKLRQSVDD